MSQNADTVTLRSIRPEWYRSVTVWYIFEKKYSKGKKCTRLCQFSCIPLVSVSASAKGLQCQIFVENANIGNWKTGRRPSVEDRKTTFGGRRPKEEDNFLWKTTLVWRRPTEEDDLRRKSTYGGRRPTEKDDLRRKSTYGGRWPSKDLPRCLLRFAAFLNLKSGVTKILKLPLKKRKSRFPEIFNFQKQNLSQHLKNPIWLIPDIHFQAKKEKSGALQILIFTCWKSNLEYSRCSPFEKESLKSGVLQILIFIKIWSDQNFIQILIFSKIWSSPEICLEKWKYGVVPIQNFA